MKNETLTVLIKRREREEITQTNCEEKQKKPMKEEKLQQMRAGSKQGMRIEKKMRKESAVKKKRVQKRLKESRIKKRISKPKCTVWFVFVILQFWPLVLCYLQ